MIPGNKCQPLDKESAETLCKLLFIENQGRGLPVPEGEMTFLSQIVKKRIEAMKLPVIIKNSGLIGLMCFAKNPGQAVALLIDFLTHFEGQELTANRLCELYPYGFYTEEALTDYIDNQLKPKKTKWSRVY